MRVKLIDYISTKFYLGITLIAISLLGGAATKFLFFLYFYDEFIRWAMLVIYIATWPMLVVGVWWAGRGYYEAMKKYFSYQFYHQSMVRGAKGAYNKTKSVGENVKSKFTRMKK